ncbi:amidase [Aurantivibrio infirmus]
MAELIYQSAESLAKLIRSKAISSRELLQVFLNQIENVNPKLNAIVTLDIECAFRRADELDKLAAKNSFIGQLHGLPITVKDTLQTKNVRTTAGSLHLTDNYPKQNAQVVQRLLDEGAILFGKSNTPEFAADLQTTNKVFGRTNNPWDLSRTPGGSSGGSAAVVAAGMAAFDIGSDIGGSLRTPAHFCGVYTLKPSYGIVPSDGLISGLQTPAIPRDISCIGPLTRSASDLALLTSILAAPSYAQERAWQLNLPKTQTKTIQECRVAAWLDDEIFSVDDEVREVMENCIVALEKEGLRVDRNAKPDFKLTEAFDVYLRLLAGATSAGMSDDAYARRMELVANADAAMRGKDIAFRSTRYALQTAQELFKAQQARLQLQQQWQEFYQGFDILLCPNNIVPAFSHIETKANFFQNIIVNGKPREYAEMLVWVGALAGVAHLPAVSAPIGLSRNNLPVGMQIIAPYLEDHRAIDFAHKLASVVGGFQIPPIS